VDMSEQLKTKIADGRRIIQLKLLEKGTPRLYNVRKT